MQKLTILFFIVYSLCSLLNIDILRFWNKERMLKAKPMDLIMIDKEPFQKTISKNETIEVPKEYYSKLPFESSGRFFFTHNGESYSCSANLVDKTIIMTAGHCVSSGRGSFFKDFMYCPQYYLGECPKGKYPGNKVVVTSEWHNTFYLGKDYSFLKLGNNERNDSVSKFVNPLKIIKNLERNQECVALGYPANIGGGEKMVQSIGKQSMGHTEYDPPTVRFPSTMTFGSSGGGFTLNQNMINSLVSYGSSRDPEHLYGPYFDDQVENLKRKLDEN